MWRRRRLTEAMKPMRRAFEDVLREVEPAKAALTDCMPSTRMPGRPLPDALLDYESHLRRARELMPDWRCRETQDVWAACGAGIDEALAFAQRLREEAPDLGGFEGLLGTVEALMDPLTPFEAAAARFDELRR